MSNLSAFSARATAVSIGDRPALAVIGGANSACSKHVHALACMLLQAIVFSGVCVAATPPVRLQLSNAELEQAGAIIGEISIVNADVFDLDDPRERNAFYRFATKLHPVTRPHVIRAALLIKPGDVFSARLLAETERLLRAKRYLGEASITPVRFVDGKVDLEVRTRDVWSLDPGISFGRRGGENHFGIELQDVNFLGTGIELDLEHKNSVDRVTNSIQLASDQAFGDRNELDIGYSSNSDGNGWQLSFEQPFYALDTRRAYGVRLERNNQVDTFYQLGEVLDRYLVRGRDAELYGGWSSGLSDGWVRRWTAGFTQHRRQFETVVDSLGTGLLPADRDLVYPWIGFELQQDDYQVWENRNQIGRSEDVLIGTHITARIGRTSTGLGSDRSAWLYQFGVRKGYEIGTEDFLLLNSEVTGRKENSGHADVHWDSSARYYRPISEKNLLFAKIETSWGHNLDLDRVNQLGGDNGLRGYPLRYQGGQSRALLTLEQRYYTDWYPFRLFRVGAAVFVDIGRTWGDDGLGTPNLGLLKDVGIGLRLGNTRSSIGNVIHIDLAFPLDGPSSIDRVQLLLEARREF